MKTTEKEHEESVTITCTNADENKNFQVQDVNTCHSNMESCSAISVLNLTKRFGNIAAVDHASFHIKQGEIFGFLGPNGAGKTTTIKAILGLLYPDQGKIRLNGIDIFTDEKKAKNQIGYLPEKVAFYDNLTALQNLVFYAELKHVSKECCLPLLKEFGLEEAANKKVGTFSKGMTQRLGMARAVLGNPSILILDEPSSGLDPRGVIFIRERIKHMKEQGCTVFVSSHILSEIQEVCDRVCIINKGRIVAVDKIESLGSRLQLRPKIVILLQRITDEVIAAVEKVKDVETVQANGTMLEVTCQASSKANVILAVIKAKGNIMNLQIKEPSLEEVFMRFTED